ncbi:MAG: hypothetical protein Q9157_000796 [Trypethelium eluteriae]
MPEVKDRTLEEIDEMFEKRLPARKFRTYKCVGRSTVTEIDATNIVFSDPKVVAETTVSIA